MGDETYVKKLLPIRLPATGCLESTHALFQATKLNQVAWKIKDSILYHNISDVIITIILRELSAIVCNTKSNTKSKDYLIKITRSKALEEIASKLGQKKGKVQYIN